MIKKSSLQNFPDKYKDIVTEEDIKVSLEYEGYIYKVDEKYYTVVEVYKLLKTCPQDAYIVFEKIGGLLDFVTNDEITEKVIQMYNEEEARLEQYNNRNKK